jgi:hypothetical protein
LGAGEEAGDESEAMMADEGRSDLEWRLRRKAAEWGIQQGTTGPLLAEAAERIGELRSAARRAEALIRPAFGPASEEDIRVVCAILTAAIRED